MVKIKETGKEVDSTIQEEEQKLVVVIMGQDCEKFIGMCLESVKDADALVYCDGGSKERFWENPEWEDRWFENNVWHCEVIENHYNQEDKGMNGKQRNFYLNYLKKNFSNWWCLALDADEVVEDLSKIKEMIQEADPGLYSVRMRHFEGDLGHEDATKEMHFVPNRLFKVSEAGEYPEVEHPVLVAKDASSSDKYYNWYGTTIWHLAYIPNMWDFKKRYENHIAKSNMHTPEFLRGWYKAHLFGGYPKKSLNPVEIPEVILNEFGITKDELYFESRGLELKHLLMTKQWKDEFGIDECIEFGCGRAPFGCGFKHIGVIYEGIELSKFAVDNAFVPIIQGDIIDYDVEEPSSFVMAFDVLEHIDYNDIDKAINNLIKSTNKHILISVPTLGDSNLEADSTHKIKESREWWIRQFTSKGLKLVPTPGHFLYKEQILIFEK